MILYGKKQFRNYDCMNGRGNYDAEKLAGMQHLDRKIWEKTWYATNWCC